MRGNIVEFFKYITKRILQVIPLLIIVSIISFFIIRLSPVDPLAELRLNPSISQETLDKEVKRLNLDKPIYVQYISWAKSFIKWDLGYTSTGEKVSVKLKERIPNTLLLTVVVIFMTWAAGIPLGILAAVKKETAFDRFLTVISSIGMAIPSFFFAILMLIFAVKTGWFPVGGLTSYNFNELGFWGKFTDIARHLILPSIVLFTISLSGLQRQMRANMLEVLDSDYVKFARAKGLSEWRVLFKHALRNAINPMITLLGFEFAGLLSGAALTEYVFQYPGLGRLILEAVMKSDINLVMASLMMGTIMLILGNLIADILLMITDPRLRKGEE
ncbi:TPA: ABC transporter substrate-binding protein [Candidatus Gastranaerophilales bacterium HUM_3]|nr:MAG TPA: ABC transporter substrate-binding protein [Candidatus Gastranaerophilales bacterium HUM_3]DAA87007.1 MAG TPA: ABC transporter substrate-binding protein [Candidatus Gastranaerophilales bacterium HUM_4]DAA92376.1 MAG TPA: ABC transporter substrate-binding protein [Candidatus Gastranaerophilales bacterium HUM_5]DAA96995.1 MAG TPA: ABC transporter substrate-binding protein [Candidatus Gastranaerophilales bacterium HUM_8]DAA98800.1 MAG TPA: ABC transporter substrate-binding protein [Cand